MTGLYLSSLHNLLVIDAPSNPDDPQAGYTLTLSGVGTEIGVPIATVGNTINGFGTAGQLGLNIVNGDFDISDGASIAFSIGDFFIDKMINKAIPGVEAPSMRDIVKALYNGLLKKES